MISAIVPFSPSMSMEAIKEFCLHFNVVAVRLDKRDNTYHLETEDGANLFWLGCNIVKLADAPPDNLSQWLVHTFKEK